MSDTQGMSRVIHKPMVEVVQHVVSRLLNGQHLMENDETKNQTLARLGDVLAVSDWLQLWYALMETHVRLALIAGGSPLRSWR